MSDQLTLPGGEPRYTKIKGENRYYDHALGKSVSHRAYWTARKKATGAPVSKQAKSSWSPEKAAALRKEPAPIRATQATQAPASGSPLAAQLLEASMLGSPVVETPKAPSPMRDFVSDLAEDTKKTVESLAETVTPPIALCVTALCVMLIPAHLSWLAPDQEEAELIIEPAARIVCRNLGVTGKALGPNASDAVSLATAVAAYIIGAKTRMDEYLEQMGEYEQDEQPVTPATAAGSRASAGAGAGAGSGGARTAPAAYDGLASPAARTPIFGQGAKQGSPDARGQAVAGDTGAQPGQSQDRKQQDAAKVRALLNADYEGRLRLGLN